jgi:regulator of replication initiation timing
MANRTSIEDSMKLMKQDIEIAKAKNDVLEEKNSELELANAELIIEIDNMKNRLDKVETDIKAEPAP